MTGPSREEAWQLLAEWTPSESLRKHGLAVEATVAWYGENRFGIVEPELETWRVAGLLHDFDYERYPETHPMRGAEELRRLGYPEAVVEAVLGHGDHTGVPRITPLAKTIYACDEMSGFVIAVTYVRPNRSLDEVDPHAVVKKMKDKGFARPGPARPAAQGRRRARRPVRGPRRQRHRRAEDGAGEAGALARASAGCGRFRPGR